MPNQRTMVKTGVPYSETSDPANSLQKKQTIPALQAVKTAVLSCIPHATDFYHDTSEDQIMIHLNDKGVIPFNYLSDGYRNTVAMVADIAHRASRLNPHHSVDVAKKTTGVVLIDEIDLHLHPKWQRRIVRDLQTAFPNLQFIATTHSPFILQSLEPGEVIDLNLPTRSDLMEFSPQKLVDSDPASSFLALQDGYIPMLHKAGQC